jgi:acyl-CoA synthetase (AMP-forming)/AMP-acid ligase II
MPGEPTLVHLLARAAGARPSAEAVIAGDRRVTYDQLWNQARRAAGFLSGQALRAGDRVCLLMRNSPEYVACYYGVLAAGGVVVPLNQEAKARDLAVWVRHAAAGWVIADGTHPEREALAAQLGSDAPVIPAADVLAGEPAAVDPDQTAPASADDLASIIYTSGTTGDPKGVMLSHGNLASNVLAIVQYLRLTASDRVLAALPFFYSYGNSVLHTHLAVGATVVLEAGMMYPQRIVETMRKERVTGFSGVPWMFVLLLDRTAFGTMRADLPALRYFTQAGAAMAAGDIARVRAAFPDVEFFVMYGQTEATARLTYVPPSDVNQRVGSAGQPIPGVRLEVRRPDGSIASPGEAGEVHAAGPNVMLGYWNAAEATAAAIATDSGGRWLRTGDIGHRDADGYLFLVGRSSEIIKTGAHRVSPAEIEEVVLRLAGVAEAGACGVPDDQLGEAIQVVVVPEPGVTLTERDVLAHCRRELSLYKMPKRVRFSAALPRTTSGKIRRKALADLTNLEAVPWAH